MFAHSAPSSSAAACREVVRELLGLVDLALDALDAHERVSRVVEGAPGRALTRQWTFADGMAARREPVPRRRRRCPAAASPAAGAPRTAVRAPAAVRRGARARVDAGRAPRVGCRPLNALVERGPPRAYWAVLRAVISFQLVCGLERALLDLVHLSLGWSVLPGGLPVLLRSRLSQRLSRARRRGQGARKATRHHRRCATAGGCRH